MPVLKNARYERFCQEFIKDPSDAGAAAARAGFSPKGASQAASRLRKNNPDVDKRIVELQGKLATRAVITADTIVQQLQGAHILAMANVMPAAAVSAAMGTAKVLGLIVDKSLQVTARLEDMTEPQIRALLGLGPNDPLPLK